jgi:hypothetical protein
MGDDDAIEVPGENVADGGGEGGPEQNDFAEVRRAADAFVERGIGRVSVSAQPVCRQEKRALARPEVSPIGGREMRHPIQGIAAAALAIVLASCGASPNSGPPATRFLSSTGTDISQRIERLPFKHSWRDPKVNIAKYKNIVVRPVTTAFLRDGTWTESRSAEIPSKRAYLRQVRALARYWDKSLAKSFSSPICIFYKTSDAGRPNTLIMEVALTEVRFPGEAGKPAAAPADPNATVLPVTTGVPVCAFEARVTDAATGALVSTVADRRGPDLTLAPATGKSPATPNEEICDEWSRQLMEASNVEIFPKVRRRWFGLFQPAPVKTEL